MKIDIASAIRRLHGSIREIFIYLCYRFFIKLIINLHG